MTLDSFGARSRLSVGDRTYDIFRLDAIVSDPYQLPYSLRVLVHPSILERLRSEDADLLVRMEKLFGVKLAFRADLNYHVENFKIINAITGEEYR